MFVLYKTVERPDGLFETHVHGSYANQRDAEQVGENLRLLYPWIKAIRVEDHPESADAQLALSRKKMAGSIHPEAEGRRKLSS
jgi:hypothetical protein